MDEYAGSDEPVEVATSDQYRQLAGALLDPDRRSGERLSLNLLAQCLLSDGSEVPALMLDISDTGLAIQCAKRGGVGEPVIVYIDRLGRFEGTIVRHVPRGFAVELRLTQFRREKLRLMMEQLTEPTTLEAARHLGWMKAVQNIGNSREGRRMFLVRKSPE